MDQIEKPKTVCERVLAVIKEDPGCGAERIRKQLQDVKAGAIYTALNELAHKKGAITHVKVDGGPGRYFPADQVSAGKTPKTEAENLSTIPPQEVKEARKPSPKHVRYAYTSDRTIAILGLTPDPIELDVHQTRALIKFAVLVFDVSRADRLDETHG